MSKAAVTDREVVHSIESAVHIAPGLRILAVVFPKQRRCEVRVYGPVPEGLRQAVEDGIRASIRAFKDERD